MNVLSVIIVGIHRIKVKTNGNIVLELDPDTVSEILYHVLALGCVILLAADGELVAELIKAIVLFYVVKEHGGKDI